MNIRQTTTFAICVLVIAFQGCGPINRLIGKADDAVTIIDRAVDTINRDSTKWNSTLREVSEQLPKDVQSTIRNEITQLAERSIAQTGVEFKCSTDFLGRRAVQALQRIKAMIQGSNPPELPPAFCHILPGTLNFNEPPQSRATVELAGYDLDHRDAQGKALRLVMISDATGKQMDFPDNRVGRTTHYVHWLNVDGQDIETLCRTERISKIRVFWGDAAQGELLVIPRTAKTKITEVPLTPVSHTPAHVEGDKDFNVHDDEHMSFWMDAYTKVENNRIWASIHMRAREERSDWTTVDSTKEWTVVYTPDPGWQIKSASPLGESHAKGDHNSHDTRVEKLGSGGVVERFEMRGDHEGDDAGTYTSMTAYFNPVRIELEEIIP